MDSKLMILLILTTIWFAALVALAVRIAIVRRERTGPTSWERSPHLLDAGRDSLQRAVKEAMEATPVVSSSESAATEHVRDGAQEDLYVGP
ncbi:MAG: hypothetical protein WAU77_02210 [Solirubrobacteraceae bacterium]